VTAIRGFLAPWIGGASLPASTPGYRSLLAFWAGGACIGVAPGPEPPIFSGGGVWHTPAVWADGLREKRITNDDLLLLLAAQVAVMH
jgi:hypothetical protein